MIDGDYNWQWTGDCNGRWMDDCDERLMDLRCHPAHTVSPIHCPQIMQIVMTPVSMATDGLVTRYIRGIDKLGAYDEVMQL